MRQSAYKRVPSLDKWYSPSVEFLTSQKLDRKPMVSRQSIPWVPPQAHLYAHETKRQLSGLLDRACIQS